MISGTGYCKKDYNMNRLFITILVTALILVGCSSSSTPTPVPPSPTTALPEVLPEITISDLPTPEDFILHISEEDDFQIDIPPDWGVDGLGKYGDSKLLARLGGGDAVSMVQVQVLRYELGEEEVDLEDITRTSILGAELALKDFHLYRIGKANVNGMDAVLVDFQAIEPSLAGINPEYADTPIRLLGMNLKDNDFMWRVTCMAPSDLYDEHEVDLHFILNSFQLLGGGQE